MVVAISVVNVRKPPQTPPTLFSRPTSVTQISITTYVTIRTPILRCAVVISVFTIVHGFSFLTLPLTSLYIVKLAETITIYGNNFRIIPVGTGLIPDKTGCISHFQALPGDESPRQRGRAPRIRRKIIPDVYTLYGDNDRFKPV